ncbi:MAG: FHA domain-containing protein [Hyphomicrobiaceae bacterium]
MTNRDKTQTVHIPAAYSAGTGANMDNVSTQVLGDKSNVKVGELVVIEGAGRGEMRPVFSGSNQVGRSDENRIPLDFGDTTISRLQHAVITYDVATNAFRIYDGGKQNPIHLNGERLTSDRPMQHGDTVRIGMTTLRFSVT